MYGYIYKTTDLSNGKIYIGLKKSSKFLEENYLGSGTIIRRIIKKCKEENINLSDRFSVELLKVCDSLNELNIYELYYISLFNSRNPDIGYNLTCGGEGGDFNLGKTFSAEVNKKKGRSGIENGMYGKHHTEEAKLKNSLSHKGKKYSKDINMKKGRPGKTLTEEHKEKISNSRLGKKFSAEHKLNLSKSRLGKIFITDGLVTKLINENEFDNYDKNIWRKGRTFNSNPWNKGLTAVNNEKLKEIGRKIRNTRKERNNYIPWNKKSK